MARLRAAFFLNEGQEQSAAPIVMVAGGSGMAPIASMLRSLAEEHTDREIVFYYGTRARSVICSGAR